MHETTSVSRGPQRRPQCRRAGVSLAAAGTVTLLAAGRSASFASSSPAPARSSSAPGNGYLYWSNGNWIGRAQLNGADSLSETRLTEVRPQSIGFIFQTFNLIPTLTAAENIEAALIPLGTGQAERRGRTAAALESVGLADRANHLPGQLSGGQQQRVAIARALVKDPTVVLADEPTGNLDEDTRDDIISLLERLWRQRGLTLVLVTHDTSIARRAQRTGVMTNGCLTIRQDSPNG
jgi:putative ABC transport system ATP-binding protein